MTAIPDGWEFDHIDPWLAPRMNQVFAEIRDGCPIVHSTKYGGFWAALTHAAVKEVTGDPQTYSSSGGITIPKVHSILQPPIEFDPPEHAAYRKIIQRQFTRQGAAHYEPFLRRLVRDRLTELIGQGSADLVPTLARHLPPMAIAVILGLPPEDGERFVEWTTRLLMTAATGEHATEEFICPRDRNPHVTFGSGIHRCIGEHLAVLEMRIIAEELLAMAPDYRIADGYQPDWMGGPVVRGLTTLPVTFRQPSGVPEA